MIILLIFLQISEINAIIISSKGDRWGVYKIKRAKEFMERNLLYAKKDLMDVLNSDLSDSVKGKAIKILMFLPPDTFKNAEISLKYLLNLHFYKERKKDLWFLFYYFKSKKRFDLCEKILRKIASDYPEERKKAQEEMFEIFLKSRKFKNLYPLLDFIKKERPDLYLLYLISVKDTIQFLFAYDTLKERARFPYADSLKKIFFKILGFENKKNLDPDSFLFKEWEKYFFVEKNKKKADSLRKILTKRFGYILPLFPDSSYIPVILENIMKDRKIYWEEIYKRGLYEFIYKFADEKNKFYLPSFYFTYFINKNLEIPDTLRGDSLWISLLLFEKDKKGINFVPSGYLYLKGRLYYKKGDKDSALKYLLMSKYPNDLSIALDLLIKKGDTLKADSLIKKCGLKKLLEFKKAREALVNLRNMPVSDNIMKEIYYFSKKNDCEILKKFYKIFVKFLFESKNFKELYKLSLSAGDDTLKTKALLFLGRTDFAEFYFRKRIFKNEFVLKNIFEFYAKNGNIKGIEFIKKYLKNKSFEKEKLWIDSVFSLYKKAISYLKKERYEISDSIFDLIKNDIYLKDKVLFEKGTIYYIMGKLHDAKKIFKYLFDNKGDLTSLYNYTVILRKLSHDSTLYYFKVYLKNTEGKSDYYFAKKRLAYLYMDRGEYEKAKELMEDLLGLSPSDFEEKELKFFYMQVLRALLDFEGAMREGAVIWLNYKKDELFSKSAYQESLELSKILKFNLLSYFKNK